MKLNLLSPAHVVKLKVPVPVTTTLSRTVIKITPNPGTNRTLTPSEQKVFEEFISTLEKTKPVSKEFFVLSIGQRPKGHCLSAVVCGSTLSLIQKIVYFRNLTRPLNVKVILTLHDANEPDGGDSTVVFQLTQGPKMEMWDSTSQFVQYGCSKKLDEVLESMETRADPYIVKVQVEVDLGDYIPALGKLLQPCDEVTRRIFEARKYTDFNIETSEGTILPCHRTFLSGRSKVLAATIDGDFKEAKEGRLLMSELSTNSAMAFLEYVYCNSVDAAITNCKVAFELLKASDYYDMPVLWSAMTQIMLLKRTSWFGPKLALQTFDFVLKKTEKEGHQELKLKLIQILAVLSKDLDACPLFRELFPTTVSREFFISTLSVVQT